jgi:hypothetical protein
MQFAFQQRCARIDFEEDVLGPEIEAMKSGKAFGGMPPAALFEFEFIDATADPVQNSATASDSGDPAE